jgi:hypothetical protein
MTQRLRDWREIVQTAAAAVAAGKIKQLPDGSAGIFGGLNAADSGDSVAWQRIDQFIVPKNSAIALLDGGRAFWDKTNAYMTYFRKQNDGDFYAGRVVGDALVGSTTCVVNFNQGTREGYDYDIGVDPFSSVIIGGATLLSRGGAYEFVLAATNEAEKVDVLCNDGFATGAGGIVEGAFTVVTDDSSTNAIFSIGVASATHATAFASIANGIGFQVKNHDTKIYALSQTASVTVNPTDTTKTYTAGAGNRVEVWIDLRIPAAPVMYVNGVPVLTSTVFNISASAVAWKLIAHLVKASSTDTMDVQVEWLRARLQQTSP